jgi:hypothetical protein
VDAPWYVQNTIIRRDLQIPNPPLQLSIRYSPQRTPKWPNSKLHVATRKEAIAKTPDKWPLYQIPSVIVVLVILVFKSYSQKPQATTYFTCHCINVYTLLHNLLNVLVQIANKMGLQKIEMSWCYDQRPVGLPYWCRHSFGAYDQILLFSFFYRKIALLFVLGRPLWRENGPVICSAICQWSESWRTHNYILLSHLRLLCSSSVASYDL